VALSQGRFTWRHDQVLQCLDLAFEGKHSMTNKLPSVLWSGSARIVQLIELTVPWEDAVQMRMSINQHEV